MDAIVLNAVMSNRTEVVPYDFDALFLKYARSRPVDEIYDAFNIEGCALAQFVKSEYGATYTGSYSFIMPGGAYRTLYSDHGVKAAIGIDVEKSFSDVRYIDATGGHTWGGVVARLEELLSQEKESAPEPV